MKIIDKHDYRVLEKSVQSDKVVFVFTAMGTKIGLYRLFMKLMNQAGYTCIMYDYPLRIVQSATPDKWEIFFTEVIADAQARLKHHQIQGATHFYTYGVSMGTLLANKFARSTPEIDHVILNLTYGDVASNLWTFKGVKKAKETLERHGFSQESAREAITFMDPIATAHELQGKKVLLHLSLKDKVLVWEQTQHTLAAFKKNISHFTYVENKFLGHYVGGVKNMLSIKRIKDFYNS